MQGVRWIYRDLNYDEYTLFAFYMTVMNCNDCNDFLISFVCMFIQLMMEQTVSDAALTSL